MFLSIGSAWHKRRFLKKIAKDSQENIWLNDLNILKHQDQLTVAQKELAELDETLKEKGKPASNEQKKRQFVLERSIENERKEIERLTATKSYNEYVLHDLLPRFSKS